MTKMAVNSKIINKIKSNCPSDTDMKDFLINLLFEEVEGLSKWKNRYSEDIEKYSENWRNVDEDR
jgi:hypothetical protein